MIEQHFKKGSVTGLRVLFVFCALLFSAGLAAQVYYTNNPKYLKRKSEQNNLLSDYRYYYPDTIVTNLSNYFPRNFLGNTGLPSPDYTLKYGTEAMGFRFFQAPSVLDRIAKEEIDYYRSKGPYASLTGVAGSRQFQAFKMIFTHTYKEKVNVTIRFNRYLCAGFYKRQQTYTNNFYLSSNYTTRSQRFGYYFYLLNNGNRNQENGGIRDGALNDSTAFLTKELMHVRLNNAERDNREVRVMANPWVRLNKRSDSLHTFDQYIQLKSSLSVMSFKYTDANIRTDTFYRVAYLDTMKTRDSSRVFQVMNELDYSILSKNRNFGLSFGYRNEINRVYQLIDSVFMNHILRTDLVLRRSWTSGDSAARKERSFEDHVLGEYVVSGPNSGNYKLENRLIFRFNEKQKRYAFLNALYEQRSPDYMHNIWISNHFFWFNRGIKAQQQFQVKAGLSFNNFFSVSVFNQTISNYIYFDQTARPAQYAPAINNSAVQLDLTKIFFRHLGISLNYIYQVTSKPDLVRIPQNTYTAKLFYHGNLFKNNLQLQLGGQVQIYDAFKSYAYMPVTQVFYLQDRFVTEAYPYVDIFLQARIRPVSFFIKVENALYRFAGNGFALTPGYYQADRAFRLGINWVFFD